MLCIGFIALACNKLDLGDCGNVCTEEFRYVTVRVELNGSIANAPDSVLTYNTVLNRVYKFERNPTFFPVGFYPLITDGQFSDINKDGTKLEFVIYKDRREVKRVEYVVGHDCCHVVKISGPDVISMD